ncbi:MAG: sulfite exporter TauE/SafE family protein [Bacteroidales bacterium]|nr:sulfite exporter TauE/SafE family protein [Bacteroidales bacterium]
MEYLQTILESSQYAALTAFILGLMTAISPCPLATNISAIGFISRDIEDRRKVFLKGLVYTLGRAITYTGIGVIIFVGASKMDVSLMFQGWGEKILGPVMILVGLFMLDFIKLRLPGVGAVTDKMEEQSKRGYLGALLLGIVFAMAFCPYSGVLYFVMLIPMTVASPDGLFLPLIFALATGLPVIIFAWFLAFAVGNVGKLYDRIKVFERWFRRVVAVLFILVGIYYVIIVWI